MKFDLSTRGGRYRARKAGFDVPKQKSGMKTKPFESLVESRGECLIWTGSRNRDGYGRYHKDRHTYVAHRYAWEKTNGPLQADSILMHSCDNPACVNVNHLSIGTHQSNQADKFAKGRQAKGEKIGTSKLSEKQVLEIRARVADGARKIDLAAEYGVHRDTIRFAINKYWRHLA